MTQDSREGALFMVCVATPDAFDALCGGGGGKEEKDARVWDRTVFI